MAGEKIYEYDLDVTGVNDVGRQPKLDNSRPLRRGGLGRSMQHDAQLEASWGVDDGGH
jgi:hypothetical protein